METGETADSELEQPRPLQDANVAYERAAAEERQKRDALVATWRDWLHYSMQSPGGVDVVKTIHAVMDSMDTFLNHAGGRRK
jgi:hypothetical protein